MSKNMKLFLLPVAVVLFIVSCNSKTKYDTIIRNGTVYDGNGGKPFVADIGIIGDTIAAIGDLKDASAGTETDAKGKAVSPGFINMLSWADESLIQDGRSQSDIRQGVTLEIFGEGSSMGPMNAEMKDGLQKSQGDIRYKVEWNTLGEYLNYMEKK